MTTDDNISEYTKITDGEVIRSKLFMNNKSFQITIPKDIIEQYELKKDNMIKLQVVGLLRKEVKRVNRKSVDTIIK